MSLIVEFFSEVVRTFGGLLFKWQSPWIVIITIIAISGIAYVAGRTKGMTPSLWTFTILLSLMVRMNLDMINPGSRDFFTFVSCVAIIMTCIASVVSVFCLLETARVKAALALSKAKKKTSVDELPVHKMTAA